MILMNFISMVICAIAFIKIWQFDAAKVAAARWVVRNEDDQRNLNTETAKLKWLRRLGLFAASSGFIINTMAIVLVSHPIVWGIAILFGVVAWAIAYHKGW